MPVVLSFLTLTVYAPILWHGWVYDDANWLPQVTRPIWALAPFRWANWVGSGEPWAFHALGLGMHLLCGALLWSIGRRWISRTGMSVALALFLLHPIQVEAVAYASGSLEVLVALYALLAVWCWRPASPLHQATSVACLLLAVSLKWSAWPMPAALLVVGYASLGLDWLAPTAAAVVVGTVAIVTNASTTVWVAQTVRHWSALSERLLLVCGDMTRGLGWIVWPAHLAVEHPPLGVWHAAFGAVAWLGAGVVAWRVRSARHAWLWVTALFVPRMLSPETRSLTEHHWYLPAVAIWLLVGVGVDRWRGVYGRSASLQHC